MITEIKTTEQLVDEMVHQTDYLIDLLLVVLWSREDFFDFSQLIQSLLSRWSDSTSANIVHVCFLFFFFVFFWKKKME